MTSITETILESVRVLDTTQGTDTLLQEVAMMSVVTMCNIKAIHFHCIGDKFKDSHELGDTYYSKILDEVDFLCELCREDEKMVPNWLLAGQYYPEDILVVVELSDYDKAIQLYRTYLNKYVQSLTSLREVVTSDVASTLDDMIRYWNKEIDYRLRSREID